VTSSFKHVLIRERGSQSLFRKWDQAKLPSTVIKIKDQASTLQAPSSHPVSTLQAPSNHASSSLQALRQDKTSKDKSKPVSSDADVQDTWVTITVPGSPKTGKD
jgi:hypothetical protein